MKVVTAAQMKEIDRITIEEIGIPSAVLMERAGVAVAGRVGGATPCVIGGAPPRVGRRVVVLCGGGNNGGDGLVAGRELLNRGFKVRAFMLSEEARLSAECRLQFEIARRMGVDVSFKTRLTESDFKENPIVIDALIGTGLNKPVGGVMAKVINLVNSRRRDVFSVDLPSGISADDGRVMGVAVRAGCTVTFGLPKRGHLLYPGKEFTGELFVEDIGFPTGLLTSDGIRCELMEQTLMETIVPLRPAFSHKGSYGHVLVVGGSPGKPGAPLMTARAAMKTGAGLVTLAVPSSIFASVESRLTEEMAVSLPDTASGGFSRDAADAILELAARSADVVAIGPGLLADEESAAAVWRVISHCPVPVVVDAGALTALSLLDFKIRMDALQSAPSPVILTPHSGEMARLASQTARAAGGGKSSGKGREGRVGGSSDGSFGGRVKIKNTLSPLAGEALRAAVGVVESDRIEAASAFAKTSSAYVTLKGTPTVITDPEGAAFINPTGSQALATAGSGDVLTGMIASLAGQGLPPLFAAMLGVYMHGLCGESSHRSLGAHSTTASDVIENIPEAFRLLIGKRNNDD
jgi:NAD(P)H-hydrate epimerase